MARSGSGLFVVLGVAITRRATRVAAVLLAASLASGCARDYHDAVVAFYDAANANQAAVVSNQTVLRDILVDAEREAFLQREARLDAVGCESNSVECRLEFGDRAGVFKLTPAAMEPPMQNIVALAGDLKGYAAALKAIAESNAVADVEAAVDDAGGKLKKLVDTTGQVASKIGATGGQSTVAATNIDWATPAALATKWVLGQYIRSAQLDALQDATSAGKKPVEESVVIYQQAAEQVRRVQSARLAQSVTEARTALSLPGGRNARNYENYLQSVMIYQGFIDKKPAAMATSLGGAHTKLTEALHGSPRSLAEALKLIDDVIAQAAALQKVVAAFQEAQKQRLEAKKAGGTP